MVTKTLYTHTAQTVGLQVDLSPDTVARWAKDGMFRKGTARKKDSRWQFKKEALSEVEKIKRW